jgi:phage terminase large subunit-like protein
MLRKWTIDYALDCISGDVVCCVKFKQACKRFLQDIERENTPDFGYIFDEKAALKFLKWMGYFKHRKGVLAGKYINPEPIQIFIYSNVYGWKHRDTGLRRFRKAYVQMARKNAKTQSLALVASYEASAFGEDAAEVYCAATKKEQAKLVYDETDKMLASCPDLKGKFKTAYGTITHLKSDSIIRALSKEDRKTGDGLNPSCGIVDEYHSHQTSEIYDILISGMAARKQPLMFIITTAGFELAHPCYSVEYNYVSQILDPDNPIDNDEYFVAICELDKDDDIKDERNWIKANPIVASYPEGLKYLREELKIALDVPEKMRNFLTKNMNVWVDQKAKGYMILSKWRDCGVSSKRKMPKLTGKECYVGVDLSSKIDLTSLAFEFPLGGNKYAIKSHSFMPEDTLTVKRKTDKVPYDLWIKQGWLTATPGAVVDYKFVQAHIERQAEKNGWIIKEICFDPYNATQLSQDMMNDGFVCVEIRQGYQTLSEPTKSFRECVYSGLIYHDNDPVLTWAISNAITRQNHNDNIMLDKEKATQRIDPIASAINAHARAMTYTSDLLAWAEAW